MRREPPYTRATAGREQYTGDARVRALHLRYVFERVTKWSRQVTFVSIDRCSGVQCRVGVHPLVRVVVVASEVPASGLTATTFLCARARVLRRLLPQHSGNTLPVRAYFADTAMILLRSSSIADRSRGCLLDGGGIAGAHSQDACHGGARFPFLTTVARAVCATRAGARSSLVAHLRSFHRWAPIVGGSVDLCCDVTGLACAVALSLVTLVTTAIPLASVCRRLMWRTRVVRDGVTLVRSSISSPR